MTRLTNPAPQFLDGNGDPYSNGLVYFYESSTNTPKNTYADATEATLNTNPVKLDAAGRLPNVWYTGLARVVLKTVDNVQVWERDEVGSGGTFENFGEWQNFILYDANDYTYRNGLLYRSITNANQGNDPASSPGNNANWEEVRFLATYSQIKTYVVGDIVRASDGSLWRSVANANINKNPLSDSGLNWVQSSDDMFVIIKTGGGDLSALRVNEIRDGATYTLPLASKVRSGQSIAVSLPERYRSFEPTVNAQPGNVIASSTGNDTSLQYNSSSFGLIYLTSNGSNSWSI